MKFILSTILSLILVNSFCQIRLIENGGQYPKDINFVGALPGGKVFLTPNGLTYDFVEYDHHDHYDNNGVSNNGNEALEGVSRAHAYNVNFIDSNPNVAIKGVSPSATVFNFFVGDSKRWASNVKDFDEVIYTELYEGVDFKYYKYGGTVKYDYIIHPGADPNNIKVTFDGIEGLTIDEAGNLVLGTSINKVKESKPIAYQILNGQKIQIDCNFKLQDNILSFDLGQFDPCEILIIDPTLIFSTYSGSTADNWGNTATYDSGGNLYSGGISSLYSGGFFPTSFGAYQVSNGGLWDVALIKYDSLGQNIIYATYLGGIGNDIPQSLIVNENDELYVMGITASNNFPTSNAYQSTFAGGSYAVPFLTAGSNVFFEDGTDIFITKFSESGSSLIASTYIGGDNNDGLMNAQFPLTKNYGDQSRGDIFIKSNGNILVASKTNSGNFPLKKAIQDTYAGGFTDAILFEMDANLSSLLFSTYLGGDGMDAAYTVKENSNGDIVVGGGAENNTFNLLNTNFSSTGYGAIDGWLAIIDYANYKLDTGIYIGTTDYDQLYFTDLDADDNIYTYGQTAGNFPITVGAFTSGGGQFIQKWNSDLTQLIASTKIGSSSFLPDISPTAFLVNDCDNIYLSGWGGLTNSSPYIGGGTVGLPVTNDAYQPTTFGSDFYLMTLSSDLSELLYATFLGGNQSSTHVDGGTSRFDKRGIVYHAVCAGCRGVSDFPTTPGVWSNTNNSPNCNNAAFKFDLATLRARIQTNNINFNAPNNTDVCFPDEIVFQNRSVGGVQFSWDFGDGTSLFTTDTTAIIHQYQGAGLYKVTLKAIDPNTCIGQDITSINVRVNVPVFDIIDDQTICEGEELELFASGGVKYKWISNDSSFISEDRKPIVSPEASTSYFIKVEDDLGCFITDSIYVDVIEAADINLSLKKQNDCFSRTSLELINLSDGAEQYVWDFGDGQTSDADQLIYEYESDGVYDVTLSGLKEFCVFDKTITVNVQTIRVPNVFTPNNGDDLNDAFVVEANSDVDLKVFNRWGRLVYEEEKYQNNWQGLDQPAGIYYYEAIIKDELTCKGWVQLLK